MWNELLKFCSRLASVAMKFVDDDDDDDDDDRLSAACRMRKCCVLSTATVHLPRIGYNTPAFNWYGTERLIHKHLSSRGIPTYMYPRCVVYIRLECTH